MYDTPLNFQFRIDEDATEEKDVTLKVVSNVDTSETASTGIQYVFEDECTIPILVGFGGLSGSDVEAPIPYSLGKSYPNPTGNTVSIDFAIPHSAYVELKIYDLKGRCVATAVEGEMDEGANSVSFDITSLSSGIYMYRLVSGDFSATKKMVIK